MSGDVGEGEKLRSRPDPFQGLRAELESFCQVRRQRLAGFLAIGPGWRLGPGLGLSAGSELKTTPPNPSEILRVEAKPPFCVADLTEES